MVNSTANIKVPDTYGASNLFKNTLYKKKRMQTIVKQHLRAGRIVRQHKRDIFANRKAEWVGNKLMSYKTHVASIRGGYGSC